MDVFAQLDSIVLTRLFACMLQREALMLVTLSFEWRKPVAANLRRLLVSPTTPLRAALWAAPFFDRLVELTIDGRTACTNEFWKASATLLEALLSDQAIERLALKGNNGISNGYAMFPLWQAFSGHSRRMASLQHLELVQTDLHSAAELSPADKAMGMVTTVLKQPCPSLTSLVLSGNNLDADGLEAVLASLCAGSVAGQLLRFDVSVNSLGADGAVSLSKSLPFMSRLQALCAHACAFGGAGVLSLSLGLAAVKSSLVELDLAENGMGIVGLEALACPALLLQALSLRRNWIDAHDAQGLPPLLQSMAHSILKLDLGENKLMARGVQLLLLELAPMPDLRLLNLSENLFITADFAHAAFARLAQIAPRLEELNLTACRLGSDDPSLQSVVAGLPSTLVTLHLGASNLCGSRFALFLDALPMLPCLQYLGLVQARLDDEAADKLASRAPLPQLPCLQVLNISGNVISRGAAVRLASALRQGTSFRQLTGAKTK